ncbi:MULTISPECIES: single-stranded-DNA-specific exonuclease RecJ [unclassified Parvimonas]|uniref:single-stranded-DNA-specific exonuclease RecJ n=1 Tax=unclassified Parvimonas TaxID=1151464 RepID=UPI002B4A5445|nr:MULTISPECIES: single-stranded-DNA-specific exonuclease RecJ [unclassified Parvimonas]MEB3024393.1 single-stranded-DNA-specific exonuclease RecJ [Parvimonas sp. M13]MEB3088539.1 single-stranded-DNA-specific exonuclease RecJ [Parvimonas sp. M20]
MKKWFIKSDNGLTKENFKNNNEFSYITCQLLANRKIDYKNVKKFLYPDYKYLHNPFLMKDLDTAIEIIVDAIDNNLHIQIVGDYDQDGNSATVVLMKGIGFFTDNISFAIPHRVEDGYGISKGIVDNAKENGVDLIITCDNGTSAFEVAEYCNSINIPMIITDHHQVCFDGEKNQILPKAKAVINPHRVDCEYPFKELCGAGVAFKLMQALFDELGGDENYLIDLLQFVSMGTVCDVVDLVDENRFFVKKGLELLNSSDNIGVNKLKKENEVGKITATSLGFKLGPCINAAGRLESASIGVNLFLEEDEESADNYAKKLVELNGKRKDLTNEAYSRVNLKIKENKYFEDDIIVVYDEEIHESIAGIVAGRIKDYYYKPTLVFSKAKEEGILKGSARSIEDYDIISKLRDFSNLFEKLGGHAMAAGFSIKEENLDILRNELNKNSNLISENFIEKVKIDCSLDFRLLNYNIVDELKLLEPYGKANPEPLFGTKNVEIKSISIIGKNKNVIKLILSQDNVEFSGIIFTNYDKYIKYFNEKFKTNNIISEQNNIKNKFVDILYTPVINEYMHTKSIQLLIKDIR